MTFPLHGRTILVAGASSGIGAGFSRAIAAAGGRVVLGARRLDRTQALAEEIGEAALAVQLDVTDEASVAAAFDAAEARFGTVHGVVANAGIGTGGRATDVPVDGLRAVLDTNLLGSYLVSREGARRLIASGSRERGDGRIVLIGSITAQQNGTGDALYAATKAGLAHLGRQFAREWIRQGINVNTLQPGWIPTEINAEWFASARGRAEIESLYRGRLLDADSLDAMLLYLLSDASRQVTGSTFTIDDGQSL
ncbi:SDR family NAD(P)-dependent oxidoreductase [Novosphingobium mangrovi (ex Huang et al. 2023)]|uniref:SDR family oxidoreductase n=1 Tax=Novosphingobium mangrovi (ex Huang et al. 2023) TaxID=2976432 RepID=A0ABT2I6S1_9SPHN|nr:SDR family oxidoreductase [Novosphingobium mangrovi (ex Huang et al. 2023)]MCT2400518.1 SDR family oxidoreductase [Novosphingobium mangrovi (ex Huang et al. 2023)]